MLDIKELHLRAALFRYIRKFFSSQGFLEVDTPIRQPSCIPESNISPLRSNQYFLQTSPELCMKRLLAAGCEKIFQVCHCFRSEECGRLHLEEFQMLEWYRTGTNYHHLMDDCEDLIRFILTEFQRSRCSENFNAPLFPGFDLSLPWQRLSVEQAFYKYSSVPLHDAVVEDIFDEILVEKIEPHLGFNRPLFLYDYPLALGSLARVNRHNPLFVERFELYIKGVELANGFSELTDAVEQRKRFQAEIDCINGIDGRRHEMPELFLQDLDKIDTAAGIAMGLDRLFMLMMGFDYISQAVTFSPSELR